MGTKDETGAGTTFCAVIKTFWGWALGLALAVLFPSSAFVLWIQSAPAWLMVPTLIVLVALAPFVYRTNRSTCASSTDTSNKT